MARHDLFAGTIRSEKGFYVGDICYALDGDIYYGVWGKTDYVDGPITDPESGMTFAVGSTAYGDGCYSGSNGFEYGVDAGVIGIVPLELVAQNVNGLGTVHTLAGDARYEFEDGVFKFTLPDKSEIIIDTKCDDEWEEDNEYEDCYD